MNRLRALRKERKLTLKQLAQTLTQSNDFSITADALAKYERGDREPKLAVWKKLATFFNVSTGYLQGISDFRNRQTAEQNAFLSTGKNSALHELAYSNTSAEDYLNLFNDLYEGLAFPEQISEQHKADIAQSLVQLKKLQATLISMPDTSGFVPEKNRVAVANEIAAEASAKTQFSLLLVVLTDKLFNRISPEVLTPDELGDHKQLTANINRLNTLVANIVDEL